MIWDAVVVGGGPAGLSAGFYLSRAGFRTLCLERGRMGGQAARLPWLSNYPGFPKGVGGGALMGRFLEQARKYGLKTRRVLVRSVKAGRDGVRLRTDGKAVHARALILATGSRFIPLGLPGESRFYGRGLYHAVFDRADRFAGRTVGVVGGGESAAHQALALARHARKVIIFSRSGLLRAIAPLREGVARHPRIELLGGVSARRLLGNGKLSAVEFASEGGRRGVPVRMDALFVLAGKEADSPPVRILRGGERAVFRAGEAREGCKRQVVAAAADGLSRAMECERFLQEISDERRGA